MARIHKTCVIAFALGSVLFVAGTVLAKNSTRPINQNVTKMLCGGTTYYYYDGKCDITDWCWTTPCPNVGPTNCPTYDTITNVVITDKECSTEEPGSEDWCCRLPEVEKCAEEYNCEYIEHNCQKGAFYDDVDGTLSCMAWPK